MDEKFKDLLPKVKLVQQLYLQGAVGMEQYSLIEPLAFELQKTLNVAYTVPIELETESVRAAYYNDCNALLTEIIKIIKN